MKRIFSILMAFSVSMTYADMPTQDLQQVKKEIKTTQTELQRKQIEQKKITEEITRIDQLLKQKQSELNQINIDKKQIAENLLRMTQDLEMIKISIENTQAQVARLLNNQYKNRQPDALVLMLQNIDPNDKGRRIQLLSYIQRANKEVFQTLAWQQQQLEEQTAIVNQELAKLKELAKRSQKIVNELKNQKSTQLKAARLINLQVDKNDLKLKQLQADERRMSALLSRLAKQKAQQRAIERQEKLKVIQESKKTTGDLSDEDLKLNTTNAIEVMSNIPDIAITPRGSFSRMQGKLTAPINGPVVGSFGTNKESGGTWRGVFIKTKPQAVKTIFSGTVVYADELNGYGQTVIVDHDGGYLSVYIGLSKIRVKAGSKVKTGDSVGTSGQLISGEQGLYFEIRYQTKPLNPSVWVK